MSLFGWLKRKLKILGGAGQPHPADHPGLPVSEDLLRLKGNARLAYLARTMRRVEPLFFQIPPLVPHLRQLLNGIESDVAGISQINCDRLKRRFAGPLNTFAVKDSDDQFVRMLFSLGELGGSGSSFEILLRDCVSAVEKHVSKEAAGVVAAAMIHDFEVLANYETDLPRYRYNVFPPVPVSVCGDLWPSGPPSSWRAFVNSLQARE